MPRLFASSGPHTLGYRVTFIRPLTYGEQPSPRVCILERDTQAPGIWPSFHRKVIPPFTGTRGHGGPWHLPIFLGISGSPAHEGKAQPSTGQVPGHPWEPRRLGVQ